MSSPLRTNGLEIDALLNLKSKIDAAEIINIQSDVKCFAGEDGSENKEDGEEVTDTISFQPEELKAIFVVTDAFKRVGLIKFSV